MDPTTGVAGQPAPAKLPQPGLLSIINSRLAEAIEKLASELSRLQELGFQDEPVAPAPSPPAVNTSPSDVLYERSNILLSQLACLHRRLDNLG